MGCIILSGVKYYMLAEGEPYPDPHDDGRYMGAYVTFPYNGKWVAQKCVSYEKWEDITDQRFDTENQAFNFCYEYHQKITSHYAK